VCQVAIVGILYISAISCSLTRDEALDAQSFANVEGGRVTQPEPNPRTRRELSAIAMVLGAAASLQLGAATATSLFDELGPAGTVLLRLVFGAGLLLALWRPMLRGHSTRGWRLVVGFGFVVAGLTLSFYSAIDRIPLGIAATLAFMGPLTLAVVSSRRLPDLLWVGLAAAGVVLLAPWNEHALDPVGVALALANGACWAAYILVASRVGREFRGGSGLALALSVAALIVFPVGASGAADAFAQPELLLVAAAVAILSSAIPYSLEMEALRRVPAGTFGILVSLQPALAALLGFVVLGQELSTTEVIAISFVVVASAGATGTGRAPVPVEA
jgi:inner membrane transporter RhtA